MTAAMKLSSVRQCGTLSRPKKLLREDLSNLNYAFITISGSAHPAGIYHPPFPPRIIESHGILRAAVNRPLCRLALGRCWVKVTNLSSIHIHHQTGTG
jgi:hypothetical protein